MTQTVAPETTPTKPAPATPIDAKKAELGGKTWDPEWDAIVEKAVPPEMLSTQVPRDVKRFCPRFYEMDETDKRAFWAYFFQALAGAEAGLDPKTRAHHTQPEVSVPDEVTGLSGRTEGLLQLTYGDEKRYGCDFDWKADRKLPAKDAAARFSSRRTIWSAESRSWITRSSSSISRSSRDRVTGQRCSQDA